MLKEKKKKENENPCFSDRSHFPYRKWPLKVVTLEGQSSYMVRMFPLSIYFPGWPWARWCPSACSPCCRLRWGFRGPALHICSLLLRCHGGVGMGAGRGKRTGRTSEEKATKLAFVGLQANRAGKTKIFCKKCTLGWGPKGHWIDRTQGQVSFNEHSSVQRAGEMVCSVKGILPLEPKD